MARLHPHVPVMRRIAQALCIAGLQTVVDCGPAATTMPSQVFDPGSAVVVVIRPPRESVTVACVGRPNARIQPEQVTGRVVSTRGDSVRLRVTTVRVPGAEGERGLGRNCEIALRRDSTTSWAVLSRRPHAVEAGVAGVWLGFFLVLTVVGVLLLYHGT